MPQSDAVLGGPLLVPSSVLLPVVVGWQIVPPPITGSGAELLPALVALLLCAAACCTSGWCSVGGLGEDRRTAPPLLCAKSQLLVCLGMRLQSPWVWIQGSAPSLPVYCAQEAMEALAAPCFSSCKKRQ
ncbi:hypothetical protein CB1_000757007 [Camelus ferus]|nr:hypothetical protein CB1_000757007 [Camelus ferus]